MADEATPSLGKRAWVSSQLMRHFLRMLKRLGIVRSRAFKKEVIPKTGPGILAVYHESMIDALLVGGTLSRLPIFLAMSTIGNWPIIGKLAELFGVILVDRDDPDSRSLALQEGERAVRAGYLHVNFITGKCVPKGELPVYHKGPAVLAQRTGSPAYPVAIKGTGDVYPLLRDLPPRRFSRFALLRRIEETRLWTWLHNFRVCVFVWERTFLKKPMAIVFGEPMYFKDYGSVEAMTEALGKEIDRLRSCV